VPFAKRSVCGAAARSATAYGADEHDRPVERELRAAAVGAERHLRVVRVRSDHDDVHLSGRLRRLELHVDVRRTGSEDHAGLVVCPDA
jgi:hypothetical protein